MELDKMALDDPRKNARNNLINTLEADTWSNHSDFVLNLKKELAEHPINDHPIINQLNNGSFNKDIMIKIHLEYRHAIVRIFTDALLMTQFQAKQLEPRFPAGTKMITRFLVTLNILDEFGFSPGLDSNGYYQGNPSNAHYPLFEKLLDDYEVSNEERDSYSPSKISNQLKDFLEESYDDYLLLAALLATAEIEVMIFSPPLMRNTEKLGLDTNQGYYFYHGSSEDVDTDAYDDDHEDDMWILLAHAIQQKDYERVKASCLKYCDLWVLFWDNAQTL